MTGLNFRAVVSWPQSTRPIMTGLNFRAVVSWPQSTGPIMTGLNFRAVVSWHVLLFCGAPVKNNNNTTETNRHAII